MAKTIELKDKTKNQVNVLHPYRGKDGIWRFDDDEVELDGEPFVGNINTMIDAFANGEKKITIYISKDPIKDYTLVLDKSIMKGAVDGDYCLRGTTEEGWLCPATLKYFKNYPKELYVKFNN